MEHFLGDKTLFALQVQFLETMTFIIVEGIQVMYTSHLLVLSLMSFNIRVTNS